MRDAKFIYRYSYIIPAVWKSFSATLRGEAVPWWLNETNKDKNSCSASTVETGTHRQQ
jgi:hypothetical protein